MENLLSEDKQEQLLIEAKGYNLISVEHYEK